MKVIKWIFILLFSVCLIAIALVNREIVELNVPLSDYRLHIPLYLFFFATLILGIIIGCFISFFQKMKLRRSCNAEKQKIKAMQNEIDGMKLEVKMAEAVEINDSKS